MTAMHLPRRRTLEAHLEFLGQAAVLARILAWGPYPRDMIADLLDAVHRLPFTLRAWGEREESDFLESLDRFDRRWGREGLSLRALLDKAWKWNKSA